MEGLRGIRTPQNGTEIHINTAHNIRKPQTALKLPKYSVTPRYHGSKTFGSQQRGALGNNGGERQKKSKKFI